MSIQQLDRNKPIFSSGVLPASKSMTGDMSNMLNSSDVGDITNQAGSTDGFDLGTIIGDHSYGDSKNKYKKHIDNAADQQRQSVIDQLQKAYNMQESNFNNQMTDINTNYSKTASAQNSMYMKNANKLAELMASKGLASGQQGTMNSQLLASNQQALTDLNLQKNKSLTDIENAINNLQGNTVLDAQSKIAQIEAQRQNQLLQQLIAKRI